jgi:hypothetical protein
MKVARWRWIDRAHPYGPTRWRGWAAYFVDPQGNPEGHGWWPASKEEWLRAESEERAALGTSSSDAGWIAALCFGGEWLPA